MLAIGLCEAYRVSVGWANPTSSQFNTLRDDYAPGELGFDPLGLLNNASEEEKMDLQDKELVRLPQRLLQCTYQQYS